MSSQPPSPVIATESSGPGCCRVALPRRARMPASQDDETGGSTPSSAGALWGDALDIVAALAARRLPAPGPGNS